MTHMELQQMILTSCATPFKVTYMTMNDVEPPPPSPKKETLKYLCTALITAWMGS